VGDRRFRFTVDQRVLSIDRGTVYDAEVGAQAATTRETGNILGDLQERLRMVRINVFSMDTRGGYDAGERIVSIERVYDYLDSGNIVKTLREQFGDIIDQQTDR